MDTFREILHVDMNNCYASIETKLNPALRGLPIAVTGSVEERNGIVLAKSQEAKIMGVKTGEAIWEAKIKCPNLITVPPHYEEYLKHSLMAREIYYSYTNQVEPFGLDEAWLDVSGSKRLKGTSLEIANEIRNRMKNEVGVTVSIGVSFNKVFAKLGSDMKKPDAITIIRREDFKEKVWPLAVDEMINIGKKTAKKLNKLNIFTLGDLANSDLETIKRLLGVNGVKLWNYANGNDISIVHDRDYKFPIKSVGNGTTCREDLVTRDDVYHAFQVLALKVCRRLIEYGYQAYGVQITLRNTNLEIEQFQEVFSYPTFSSIILVERAMRLFNKYNFKQNIRSVGIRAINLCDIYSTQIDIFAIEEKMVKKSDLDRALYEIRDKYGKESITFASLKDNKKLPSELQEIYTLPISRM